MLEKIKEKMLSYDCQSFLETCQRQKQSTDTKLLEQVTEFFDELISSDYETEEEEDPNNELAGWGLKGIWYEFGSERALQSKGLLNLRCQEIDRVASDNGDFALLNVGGVMVVYFEDSWGSGDKVYIL